MIRFTAACTGIVLILFLGILTGMQFANQGMKEMKGYDDPGLANALALKEGGDAEILGRGVSSHDLEQKKAELQDMKAFNLFSSAGKSLSKAVSDGMGKLIGVLSGGS